MGRASRAGVLVALIAGLAISCPSSDAAVTLGGDISASTNTITTCSNVVTLRGCLAVDDVLPGRTVLAPSSGTITSWSVHLGSSTDAQTIRIRIVRQVSANQYKVISSGPLESVLAGAGTYIFGAQLPITQGDQLGIESGNGADIEWGASAPGGHSFGYNPSPPDGETTEAPDFDNQGLQHTFNGLLVPTNTFSLGTLTRNKKKGTATVEVNVPNPGEVAGSGEGAKVAGAEAVTSKSVTAPGAVTLTIKAKGKKKRKLNETGKVKLKVQITYTPTGGDPSTQSLGLQLKKKLKNR